MVSRRLNQFCQSHIPIKGRNVRLKDTGITKGPIGYVVEHIGELGCFLLDGNRVVAVLVPKVLNIWREVPKEDYWRGLATILRRKAGVHHVQTLLSPT